MSTRDEKIVTSNENREDKRQVSSKRSSTALTLKDDRLENSGVDHSATPEKAPIAKVHEDSDTLLVDWEGPDDPENPKKRVIADRISYAPYSSSHRRYAAGLQKGSGWRYSLFHLLPSSVQFLHQ